MSDRALTTMWALLGALFGGAAGGLTGALAGALIAGHQLVLQVGDLGGLTGALAGALIGFLVGRVTSLSRRLDGMEQARSREAARWAEVKTWMADVHRWLDEVWQSADSESLPDSDQPADEQPTAEPPSVAPSEAALQSDAPSAAAPPSIHTRRTPGQPPTRTHRPSARPGIGEHSPTSAPPAEAAAAGASPAETEAFTSAAGQLPPPMEPPDAARPAHVPTGPPAARHATPVADALKRWVTTGNVPVKVGVVVSVIGVGLLLREANRRDIIEITIEMRLAAAALFGLALLAVGVQQRLKRPIYGVSLQGGGIAVLYVTTYAAFAVYDVLPAIPAGAAVVAVTAGAGMLAVIQDARVLAVLGIIGGYLAPVLTYTQPEDHPLVFGFFAVLTCAIIGVAWFKTWPELNLLGFGFTFGLTWFWLVNRYDSSEWIAAQPFLAFFVLAYMALPVLFALRDAPMAGRDLPDLEIVSTAFVRGAWTWPLVVSTPFIGLGLQHLAVGHLEYGTAISAATLAMALTALWLTARSRGADRGELAETYLALSVTMLAIAVPLAFDAYLTATVWGLQGLAVLWIGWRRNRMLPVVGGAVLQALGGFSLIAHLTETLPHTADTLALVNEYYPATLVLAVAGLVSGVLIVRSRPEARVAGFSTGPDPENTDTDVAAGGTGTGLSGPDGAISEAGPWLALLWGVGWWLTGGLIEIELHLSTGGFAASLAFIVGSLGAPALAGRRLRWPDMEVLGLLVAAVLPVAVVVSFAAFSHPLDKWGWIAWPVSLGVYYVFLWRREASFPALCPVLHAVGFWVVAVLLAVEVFWQIDEVASGVWPLVAAAAAVTAFAGSVMGRNRPAWPVAAHRHSYMTLCAGPLLGVVAVVVSAALLVSDGDPEPLDYLPVLNPLLLLWLVAGVAVFAWDRLAVRVTSPRVDAADPPGAEPAASDPALSNPTSGEPEGASGGRSLLGGYFGAGAVAAALAVAGVVAVTMETARSVHHWFDVAWDLEALWDTSELHTALSVLWAVIALSGMVAGVRLVRRDVWIAGASFMAVVVAKLFLVDLSNLTALSRVVSFLVVGALLLIVGYLAPVPPSLSDHDE